MNVDKLAKADAHEWALAQMFYGEGAGVRRHLIGSTVDYNMATIPGYLEKFHTYVDAIDQTKMAEKAIAERKRIDRGLKIGKNLRALKSGNLNNLSTGVFVVVGAAYLAHATGYDEKIKAQAKKQYKKAKTEIRYRQLRHQGKNVSKII